MMFIPTLSLHSYGQFKFTITQLMYTIMLLVCASDQLLQEILCSNHLT